MKLMKIKAIVLTLWLILPLSSFASGTYPKYAGYPAMISKLEKNCAEYSDNFAYQNMVENQIKDLVYDFDEMSSFSQAEWSRSLLTSQACDIALAENTIEGMSFVLSHRPSKTYSSFNNANREMARSLLILWLLDTGEDQKKFDEAVKYADTFLENDNDSFKPGQAKSNYFLSHNIMEVAELANDEIFAQVTQRSEYPSVFANNRNYKVIKLYELAADYGWKGFKRAKIKTEIAEPLGKALATLAQYAPLHSNRQTDLLKQLETFRTYPYPFVSHDTIAEIYALRGDFSKTKSWLLAMEQYHPNHGSCLIFKGSDSLSQFKGEQLEWLHHFQKHSCDLETAALAKFQSENDQLLEKLSKEKRSIELKAAFIK